MQWQLDPRDGAYALRVNLKETACLKEKDHRVNLIIVIILKTA